MWLLPALRIYFAVAFLSAFLTFQRLLPRSFLLRALTYALVAAAIMVPRHICTLDDQTNARLRSAAKSTLMLQL